MNIPITIAYIYRDSESKVFARDMSSYARTVETWSDSVNELPTEQQLIDNEAAALAWQAEQGKGSPLVEVRKHLSAEGYDADAKVSLLHKRLANPTPGSKPKLDAVEAWMIGQQAKALAGDIEFDPKPYELDEVLAE